MHKQNKSRGLEKAKGQLETAVRLHLEKRYDDAERYYLKLLKGKHFTAKVLNLLGVLMFQTGKLERARYYFDRSLRIEPKNLDTYNNYSSSLEMSGDMEGAISVCKRGMKQVEDSDELKKKIVGYLVRTKKYEEAIAYGENLQRSNPNDLSVLANLNAACFFGDDTAKALEFGERFLLRRDARVTEESESTKGVADTKDFDSSAVSSKEQVIAFSLWGTNEFYTDGAIRNAELALEIYPDWKCRFYCASSVSTTVTSLLEELGCQVVSMDDEEGFAGTFWRFMVTDDASVGRFMIRDADSRLNYREKAAVTEWIESGKPFHVMRDAVVHCDLILAGLWGGCHDFLPNMGTFLANYPEKNPKFADQNFLAKAVWPLIRNHVLIHDSHYKCFHSRPFPDSTDLNGSQHVGAGVSVSADPPRSKM